MARDFSKDVANFMDIGLNKIGPLLHGAAKISVGCWVQPDSFLAAANNNRIVNLYTTDAAAIVIATDATSHLRCAGRSVNTDGFQTKDSTTAITADGTTSTHLGGVWNITGDAITPYLNGTAEGGGSVTFGNTTWTHGSNTAKDAIGCGLNTSNVPPDINIQYDGRVWDVGIWKSDISAIVSFGPSGLTGFAALAAGDSPLFIDPDNLVGYWRCKGKTSPEPEVIYGNVGTITGTVAGLTDPRTIGYPKAVVVCNGNSLTFGTHASSALFSFPAQLRNMLPGVAIINVGVPSKSMTTMISEGATLVDPKFQSDIPCVTTAWEGTCEIVNEGHSGTTAYDSYVTYCNARRAAGWTVVVAPVIPAVSFVGGDITDKDTCNAALIANWPQFARHFVPLTGHPAFDADADTANTTYYYTDGLHLSDTGYLTVAQMMAVYVDLAINHSLAGFGAGKRIGGANVLDFVS